MTRVNPKTKLVDQEYIFVKFHILMKLKAPLLIHVLTEVMCYETNREYDLMLVGQKLIFEQSSQDLSNSNSKYYLIPYFDTLNEIKGTHMIKVFNTPDNSKKRASIVPLLD